MVNSLFDSGRVAFLGANHDWDTDAKRLIFVDHGTDTPNVTTDDNLDDIAGGARIAESGNFAGLTIQTNGAADADDVVVNTVSGAQFESIVIFEETGVDSTSTLLVYIDVATGLPFTPSGGNITVVWDSGTNRIFRL